MNRVFYRRHLLPAHRLGETFAREVAKIRYKSLLKHTPVLSVLKCHKLQADLDILVALITI